MNLQLFNRQTQQLQGWNRADDSIPVGLDRSLYYVVEVIQLQTPTPAPGQTVRPAKPVVAITDAYGEGVNGTVTMAWVVEDIPPPRPEPDFDGMAMALRTENGFKNAFLLAFAEDPMAAGSLTSRFDEFRRSGDFSLFLQSMLLVLHALPVDQAAEIGTEFLAVAARCHMPPAFLEALQTAFNAEPTPSPPE